MAFVDEVRTRASRFKQRLEHLETEEATKSALILPFLEMLGYHIFDPTEVVPEFNAEITGKRGDKVDYALMLNGKPAVLIEAKKYGTRLEDAETSQLLRYFTATEARFGILTDGMTYQFFADLDQPNKMDTTPFLVFSMFNFTDAQVEGLERFHKDCFDQNAIVEAATGLKYTAEIKRVFDEEIDSPSQEMVNMIIRKVYPDGRISQLLRRQFQTLAPSAFSEAINERVDSILKNALGRQKVQEPSAGEAPAQAPQEEEQTPEFVSAELDALNIIKAIVRDVVDVRRVGLRPQAGYCSVLLDNNRRRNVCRLRLRTGSWRLSLDDGGSDDRIPLDDLDDLFGYADGLRANVLAVLSPGQPSAEPDTERDNP